MCRANERPTKTKTKTKTKTYRPSALTTRRRRLHLAPAQARRFFQTALRALDQLLLRVLRVQARALHVAAVGLHVPRTALVGELGVEDVAQLLLQARIL